MLFWGCRLYRSFAHHHALCQNDLAKSTLGQMPHHMMCRFRCTVELGQKAWEISSDCGGQIFVFHFPGVVERVICGMPNQIPQRPSSSHFALGMERPNGLAIALAVRSQVLVGQLCALRKAQPQLGSHVLLCAQRMPND